MKIVGLTGNTGSGKSTVSKMLELRGGYIIDADAISHDVIVRGADAYNEVLACFGTDILNEQLEIDRKNLGRIVFQNTEKLKQLSAIIHKYVIAISKEKIKTTREGKVNNFIVIDAPLLVEANMHLFCDEVWLVYADEETRIERIMHREKGITREEVMARVRSQTQYEELKKYATRVIYNNDEADQLHIQLKYALLNFIEV